MRTKQSLKSRVPSECDYAKRDMGKRSTFFGQSRHRWSSVVVEEKIVEVISQVRYLLQGANNHPLADSIMARFLLRWVRKMGKTSSYRRILIIKATDETRSRQLAPNPFVFPRCPVSAHMTCFLVETASENPLCTHA